MAKTVKLTVDSAREFIAAQNIDPEKGASLLRTLEAEAKEATPWYVIVLKTLAYLIGLLLAGYGTTAAAMTLNII